MSNTSGLLLAARICAAAASVILIMDVCVLRKLSCCARLLRAHLVQKWCDPALLSAATAMHVTSQQIVLLIAIVPAVDAMAAHHLIRVYGVGREVFQAGVMKFVRWDAFGFLPA